MVSVWATPPYGVELALG